MNKPPAASSSLVNRITISGVVAVLACAGVLGGVATVLSRHALEAQAQDKLKLVGDAASLRIGEWVANNLRVVGGLGTAAIDATGDVAGAPPVAEPAASAATGAAKPESTPVAKSEPATSAPSAGDALHVALEQTRVAGDFRSVFLAVAADKHFVLLPVQHLPADYDPTVRPWYKLATGAGHPIVTPPQRDPSRGDLKVTFAVPVIVDGRLRGAVGADKAIADVAAVIAGIKPSENSYAFVLDQDGRILIHPNADLLLKPLAQAIPGLASVGSADGVVMEANDGTRDLLVRTERIPGTDWKLAVALDKSAALAGLGTLMGSIAIAAAIVVAIVALILASVLRTWFAPLRKVRDAMVAVAGGGGDLTSRIDVSNNDEVGQIARAFNQFTESLRGIIREVQQASSEVKTAAHEIATGNADLSARTESQASSIQESASSIQQLHASTKTNSESAQEANRIAHEAAALAAEGGAKVSEVIETMGGITASSRRIGEIIGVIDSIAFQTNILALNAAVEAARAGEQGRGFAVVASEVRTLAQRSGEAARDIRQLIQKSTEDVETGAARVDDAGRTISQVVASVRSVSALMARIVEATQQQTGGIGEVNNAVNQIDQMTSQNAALVEQAAAAATSLSDQSSRLVDAVGRFRTSH